MLIEKNIKDIDNQLKTFKKKGLKIGYVPTMGALHFGHISLIKASKEQCDLTICSIFVNPTQFNDKRDYDKYPSNTERDVELLNDAECEVLFLPSVHEMYPDGFNNNAKIDFGYLAEVLEGEKRPGHFDGMAQVVEKLLHIVQPDKLFMGQKDYQQQLIVKQLINKKNFKTELIVLPTVREKDGLAMSSRNVRLDAPSRKLAVEISKTLKGVKAAIHKSKTTITEAQEWGINHLAEFNGIETEYLEIRNAETLKPAQDKSEKLVALTAVKIGGVRLIDNLLLN